MRKVYRGMMAWALGTQAIVGFENGAFIMHVAGNREGSNIIYVGFYCR